MSAVLSTFGDTSTDFSAVQQAIEDLLQQLPQIEALTDLHVQGGTATAQGRGGVRPVDIGAGRLDRAVATIGALTASALRRQWSAQEPLLEQRIPPRYRVTCTHHLNVQDGHPVMSLRLLPTETMPLSKWVEDGNMSAGDHALIRELIAGATTILIAGQMGSGKSTLLASILAEMPPDHRLVVIEDVAELNLQRAGMVALQTSHSADLTALIAHAFRHNAKRVIVGEVRDPAAAMEFMTLTTGGVRAMTTVHTEAGVGALERLHQLVLRSRYVITMDQIRSSIHAVVSVRRLPDDSRPVEVLDLRVA